MFLLMDSMGGPIFVLYAFGAAVLTWLITKNPPANKKNEQTKKPNLPQTQ